MNERSSKGCLERLKCFMTETGIGGSLISQSTSSEILARERAYLTKDNDICLNLKLLSASHRVSCMFLGVLLVQDLYMWVLGLNLGWNPALSTFSPLWFLLLLTQVSKYSLLRLTFITPTCKMKLTLVSVSQGY